MIEVDEEVKAQLKSLKDLIEEQEMNERKEVIQNVKEWITTLYSIKEILDNPFADDYEMFEVKQAVEGLILKHKNFYCLLRK